MKNRLRFATLMLLFVCVAPVSAVGSTGTLVVTVMSMEDFGDPFPIPGATVEIQTDAGLRSMYTNRHGWAVVFGLPPGEYWVEAKVEGFETKRRLIDVHSGFTRRITVDLPTMTLDCSLGEKWDYRSRLDPGIPQAVTILEAGPTERP